MIAAWIFWEHVFTDTPVELFGSVAVVAILIGAYRHMECHKTGCHRFGHFPHGHLKLCARHHPRIKGERIGSEHIAAESKRQRVS